MKEKRIKKKETRIGLDIGTRLIKILEVSFESSTQRITKFHFAEINPPPTLENIAKTLRKLFEDFHPGTKDFNISLSAPSAIVRFITMPKMKEEDLKNSLRFEAEKYIPFNIDEIIIDATILESVAEEKNQMRVLLAAAKKDAVNSRIETLKALGLSVSIIDIDSFACFNAFCNSIDSLDESKSTALLNIGYTHTNVIISRGNKPYFTRDVRIGGSDIAKAISKELQVEEDQDQLIYNPGERASQVLTIATSVLGTLIDELKLSFGYYENQYGKSINEIYMSGGVARLNGISGFLEENFAIKPMIWNPFSKFDIGPEVDTQLLELVRPQFAVCAGLAIR